jgi:hypothetical protein
MKLKALIFLVVITSFTLGFSGYVRAQDDVQSEENFDPFSDYSEFTEAASEEADINFFRNGRLLNIGISAGYKGFIGGDYAELYKQSASFGFFFTYFFDLQFAVQLGLATSDHDFTFRANDNSIFRAKMRLFDINIHGKYFLNTQNMTRAFAEWNPYIIGGVSQIRRSHSTNPVIQSTDNAVGYDVGVGVEYMFNQKKNFVGFQFLYQYVNFNDEGLLVPDPSGTGNTNLERSGDPITIMATIGINY